MNTGLTSQEGANNFNTNLYMKMKDGKFEHRKRKVEEMRRETDGTWWDNP